jgi:hypothetical protein
MRVRRYALFVFVVLFAACIAGFGIFLAIARAKPATMTVQSFLEKYANATVTHVEVFYEPWTAHSSVLLTEELMFGGLQPTVRIVGRVPYPHFTDMRKPLEKCPYKKVGNGPVDFRLGFIFRSADNEFFRLSLGRRDATLILSVNGELFEATPEVVSAMMLFLPVNAYEEMHEALVKRGFLRANPEETTQSDIQAER